tara:strand:- start:2687 stop:2998 length:312 start_codon:yes stop_codon:yes gene_type:complete
MMRHAFAYMIIATAGLIFTSSTSADHHENTASPIKANFLVADEDSNNRLDKKEFFKFVAVNANANIGPFAMIHSNNMHERAFSRMDSDGDGTININELRTLRR